jgi:hypothetical protein
MTLATSARADEAPLRVELRVQHCNDVSPAEVRRIVAIELRASVWDAPEHDPRTTRIDATCDGDAAKLEVTDPLTAKSLARIVSLDGVATNARGRLLALAIAELVSASWTELATTPEPVAPPVAPAPRTEDKEAARSVVASRAATPPAVAPAFAPTWRATATLDTRVMAVASDPLFGVGVRIGTDRTPRVGLVLDAAFEHASVASALGTIDIDAYSVGAAALARRALGPFVLRAGAGVRVGVARMSGVPFATDRAAGRSIDGVWGAPIAVGTLGLHVMPRLLLELATEFGYAFPPVHGIAGSGADAHFSGSYVGGSVGFGIEL